MDARIDLTEHRDFRSDGLRSGFNIIRNLVADQLEWISYPINGIHLEFLRDSIPSRKNIVVSGNKLRIEDSDHIASGCIRCGRKILTDPYDLCDQCNLEMAADKTKNFLFKKEELRSLF